MQEPKNTDSDKPPFFSSWRPLYSLVVGFLVLQILVFYAITRYFE